MKINYQLNFLILITLFIIPTQLQAEILSLTPVYKTTSLPSLVIKETSYLSGNVTYESFIMEEGSELIVREETLFISAPLIEIATGAKLGGTGGSQDTYGTITSASPGIYDYGTRDGFDYYPGDKAGSSETPYIGGEGGPALVLRGDTVRIYGEIYADGGIDTSGEGQAGSGGCILIAAKNLVIGASASIHANGGVNSQNSELIEGGGGRIKIFYMNGTVPDNPNVEAAGPIGDTLLQGSIYIDKSVYVPEIYVLLDANFDGEFSSDDLYYMKQRWHITRTPIWTQSMTPTPTRIPSQTPTPSLTWTPSSTPITYTPTVPPSPTKTFTPTVPPPPSGT